MGYGAAQVSCTLSYGTLGVQQGYEKRKKIESRWVPSRYGATWLLEFTRVNSSLAF